MNSKLFQQHINSLTDYYAEALALHREQGGQLEALLVHSGSAAFYFADDRAIPFQAYGHYLHWLPINKPDQFAYYVPGQKPIYFQIIPDDYWHDQNIENVSWWANSFQIIRLRSTSEITKQIPNSQTGYLGPNAAMALEIGIESRAINPRGIIDYLNYQRAYKSSYEVAQLKEANRLALVGHITARQTFLSGGSEYDIHMAYLNACAMLEEESPYTNIVALDKNAAVLHYQQKNKNRPNISKVLLIDAGCRVNGYSSDVTRTSAKRTVNETFKELLAGMEIIEQELVLLLKPSIAYPEIHLTALKKIGQLLIDLAICGGTADELLENEIQINSQNKNNKKYVPLSKRQDKPDSALWLIKNHTKLKDSQIAKLVGITSASVKTIRNKSYWNYNNLNPKDPVAMGLFSQKELVEALDKADRRLKREQKLKN